MMILLSIGIGGSALWKQQYRADEEAQRAQERAQVHEHYVSGEARRRHNK